MLGVLLILLVGCGTSGPATDTQALACTGWRPIFVSRQDNLTENTARQILAHNLTGKERCHWEPGARAP